MYRNPIVVQISDLHFGRLPYRPWRASVATGSKEALTDAILGNSPRPDFLVVTGDLASRGRRSELVEAKRYLESILDSLWEQGQATRCVVIPGNHDVWRTTRFAPTAYVTSRDRLKTWNSVFEGWSFMAPSARETNEGDASDGRRRTDRHELGRPVEHLRPFSLSGYYQTQGRTEGEAKELDKKARRICEYFPAFRLALLKLDSNVRRQRWLPEHIAQGRVGLAQRRAIDKTVQDLETATETASHSFADARRIALVHHHLTRMPNVELETWMLLEDAGETARWLARLGVRLVLHGHYHKPDLVGLTYWRGDEANTPSETLVIAAGAATARETGDAGNSYHHLEVGQFRTGVRRITLESGEYQALEEAARFDLEHRPRLALDAETKKDPPVFLQALTASLQGEERYADYDHRYNRVTSTGFVASDRSYHGRVFLEGQNVTSRPSNHVPLVFTAMGARYFEECECCARDLQTGRDLVVEEMEARPIHVFPVKIYFGEPLAPQSTFGVAIQFRIGAAMFEERDYDMLSLLRFPRGVSVLEFELVSERKMLAPMLYELRRDRLNRSAIRLVSNDGAHGFGARIKAPAALCYVLFYERLL